MQIRYFNWKLAVMLFVIVILVGTGAFYLRNWQRGHRAAEGFKTGSAAYEAGDWDGAAEGLGAYIAVNGSDSSAMMKYGNAQLNRLPLGAGELQQAMGAFRQVLRFEPGNVEAAINTCEIYLSIDRAREAEIVARNFLKDKDSAEIRRVLAKSLVEQRSYEGAADQLEKLVEDYPHYVDGYEELAFLVLDYPACSENSADYWIEKAVAENSESVGAYIAKARFDLKRGNLAQVRADIKMCEDIESIEDSQRLVLAKLYLQAGLTGPAKEHLDAIGAVERGRADYWLMRFNIALKSGDNIELEEVADDGLAGMRVYQWAILPAATELYIRAGKAERAEECILKLYARDLWPAKVAFLEGMLAESVGELNKAVRHYEKCIKLGYEDIEVRLALAGCIANCGDLITARQMLDVLVREDRGNHRARLMLCKILSQLGNWQGAIECAQSGLEVDNDKADFVVILCQAKLQMISEQEEDKRVGAYAEIDGILDKYGDEIGNSVQAALVRCRTALGLQDYVKTKEIIEVLINKYPERLDVKLVYVDYLLGEGMKNEAEAAMQDAVRGFDQAVLPVKYLAVFLDMEERMDECEQVLREAVSRLKLSSDKRQVGLLLADFYRRWGKEEEEHNFLMAIDEELEDDVCIKSRLLKCKSVYNESDSAQTLVDEIKNIEGDGGWRWRYEQAKLWFIHNRGGERIPQVIALLKKNLEYNPADQDSRVLLASAYERRGDWSMCLTTYRQALDRSPHDVQVVVPMIAAMYRAKEYDQAEVILEQAELSGGFDDEFSKLRLHSYLRSGKVDSALRVMGEILEQDPDDDSIRLALALLKLEQDDYDGASGLLSEVLRRKPDSRAAHSAQIQLYVERGDGEGAIALCNEGIERWNDWRSYLVRGRAYHSLGMFENAEADFKEAAALNASSVEVWLALTQFYTQQGRLEQAGQAGLEALARGGDSSAEVKQLLPIILGSPDARHVEKGREVLKQCLERSPEDVELALLQSALYIDEGTEVSIHKAERFLSKVTKESPEMGDGWYLAAKALFAQGDEKQAYAAVVEGLSSEPEHIKLLLLKAEIESLSNKGEAVETLGRVLRIGNSDEELFVKLCRLMIDVGNYEGAIATAEKGIEEHGKNWDDLKLVHAEALYRSGSREAAEETLQKMDRQQGAVRLKMRFLIEDGFEKEAEWLATTWCIENWKEKGAVLAMIYELQTGLKGEKGYNASARVLQDAIKESGGLAEYELALGAILQGMNEVSDAKEIYERILKVQPENAVAINNLAWIRCESEGAYTQAMDLVKVGLEKSEDYADLVDTRGMIYRRMGEYDEAIIDFRKAISVYKVNDPGRTQSYYHLACTLAESGNAQEAFDYLRKALKLNRQTASLSTTDLTSAGELLSRLEEVIVKTQSDRASLID